jgi:hypothetical protein
VIRNADGQALRLDEQREGLMPIPVICSCGGKMKVGDHLAGKYVKCPKCGAVVAVGGGAAAAAAPPPPPPPPATTKSILQKSSLSDEEQERVEDTLESGERLVWADKPVPSAAFVRAWLMSIGFGFGALVTLVICILVLVSTGGKDWLFAAIPGVLGLGLVAAGIVYPYLARRSAERTAYAFTTKRAMVWECGLLGQNKLLTYGPAVVAQLSVLPSMGGKDGVGDIVFGYQVQRDRQGAVRSFKRHGFLMVRHADRVEKLLREHLIDPFTDKLYE